MNGVVGFTYWLKDCAVVVNVWYSELPKFTLLVQRMSAIRPVGRASQLKLDDL